MALPLSLLLEQLWEWYVAALMRTILPQIVKLAIATEHEVDVDTLADRLHAEFGDDGAAVTWGFITAYARRQALASPHPGD